MSPQRRDILNWAEQGRIAEADLPRALALAGVLPSRAEWRRFIERLLLWMGTVLVAGGLIFFLAFNWHALGRYGKLALAEGAVAAALVCVWRCGLDRPAGTAALFAAALSLGALLALIGQTYQTGADTFELFAAWAAMMLPWVLVGRSSALWLLWLALVNLAVALRFEATPDLFGINVDSRGALWVLLAFNSAALAVWEALAWKGVASAHSRWGQRLLALAGAGIATFLVVLHILSEGRAAVWGAPAWLAWLVAAYAVYRRPIRDLFVLALGMLSVVGVTAVFLVKHLSSEASTFLLVGLVVIAMSAAGAWWLKALAAEGER